MAASSCNSLGAAGYNGRSCSSRYQSIRELSLESMNRLQVSLRTLLVAACLLSLLIAIAVVLWNGLADAHPSAVRQTYLDGKITLEEARQDIGDIVDTWPSAVHERAKLVRKVASP